MRKSDEYRVSLGSKFTSDDIDAKLSPPVDVLMIETSDGKWLGGVEITAEQRDRFDAITSRIID